MEHKYGNFPTKQFEDYKVKLHRDLFYLLLYKDPETSEKFSGVDFDKYFVGLMHKIDGLNELLLCPKEIVEMMALLEAAYKMTQRENFKYYLYRKLILDAHNLVDKICDAGGDCDDNSKEL